ncbi:RcnB family protein [Lysobacter niastensis]|uniref:RcnB family protein n=1 Tax=Lysobacter niastensis TaxID=380629 RepID=A0ABS0B964_9GAMM|nr:RcnB family protein [Lysobacter niastensis]MBF6025382.1 RcnB family protein [Lysobacter niastensis]
MKKTTSKKAVLLAIPLAAIAFAATPALAGDKDKPAHAQDHKGHDNGKHKGWEKQAWKRGERIPIAYIEPRYYVDDYRVYRLHAPPAGYRWVRPMDDRYLLVDVASGLITEALGY